jgi:hypothetical protein
MSYCCTNPNPVSGVGVGVGVTDGVGDGVGHNTGEGVGDGIGDCVSEGVGDSSERVILIVTVTVDGLPTTG